MAENNLDKNEPYRLYAPPTGQERAKGQPAPLPSELTHCGRLRRDRCGRCAAGSTRGVKPRPTGQSLPLPKDRQDTPGLIARRRTLSDAADAEPAMIVRLCQHQRQVLFTQPLANKPRQHASRCRSFVLSHMSDHQAEPIRGPEPPPATRNRSRAPSLACHNGTAPVARSASFPPASPVRIRQRMTTRTTSRRPRAGGDLGVLKEPHSKPTEAPAYAGDQGLCDSMPSRLREGRKTCRTQ